MKHENTESSWYRTAPFVLSCGLTSLLFISVIGFWFLYNPTAHFVEHIPGMDGEPLDVSNSLPVSSDVHIGEFFAIYASDSIEPSGGWPRFRGSDFTNISNEAVKFPRTWNSSSVRNVWSVSLGEGHAAPAVAGGRVYILDYDEKDNADALRCFSFSHGREIWRRWYTVKVKRNHGMSRTVPAANDSFVVTIGPRCHVMCVRSNSGEFMWGMDLEKQYKTTVPLWYTGQCPLIDSSIAVIAPGGTALMIGVSCSTGEVLWETPNTHSWSMSHSSIIPMRFYGRKVYVYCATGGIAGVAADGPERGMVLFESNAFNQSVVAPSPVMISHDKIFITAGYGAGSMMFQVLEKNSAFSLVSTQKINVTRGLASEQHSPLYYKGHLFSILPKDAGPLKNQFVCVNPDDCSTILWSSGQEYRFGLGPYMIINNTFFILNDNGTLTVAEATHEKFIPLGKINLIDGIDAWGPMAFTDRRFIIRDIKKMTCFELLE